MQALYLNWQDMRTILANLQAGFVLEVAGYAQILQDLCGQVLHTLQQDSIAGS